MRASSTKKYYTGVIILCALVLLFQSQRAFSTEKDNDDAGPVIAGVVINSCVGSITISVTSGLAPYTYQWEDSGGTVLASNSFVITGLGPDNYTVTVTDANSDTVTATYTVTNPPDLTGAVIVNDVTCRGDSDAQVIVTMANGNPGYDWELFNSGATSVQTGSIGFPNNIIIISGLGVDTYSLEVTDQDGCTGTINFTITEPAQFLGANLVNQTNATCSDVANGSLEVVGTGGWGGYTYAWYDSGSNLIGTNGTITGLLPGTYNVVITDANGCQVNPNYTITGPAPITSTGVITNATCNGNSDGAIDITVGGGNGSFTYSWDNGANTEDISGLTAGTYSVTITDIQGCVLVASYTVTEPGLLTINEDIRNVDCHGNNTGRIRSNVTGGTSPYTYSWSNGRTSRNINNIVAGAYSLTVTDANGCTTTEHFTVTEPTQALAVNSFTETIPSCFGASDGTVEANVVGGTAPYSYSWSNGGNTAQITGLPSGAYTVTVTDVNGCTDVQTHILNDPVRISVSPSVTIPSCNGGTDGSITVSASNGTAPYTYNWNTGDTGPTVNGLSAGTYVLTVTDNLGCSVVENIIVGEPSPILHNATVNDISCNGLTDGSIFLAVTGGTAPYTYSWNTGPTTANISGLAAGTYTVTITDGNGCTEVESFTIIEPASLGLSHTQVNVLCKGNTTGSIDLTVSGGTAPFTYLWSNGAVTQDVFSLAAGTYSVTVKDASNCSEVHVVTITEPATAINITGVETDATCNGTNTGAIDITVTGGVAPYTYSWNNGSISEDLTALAAGSYSVQVTDANGCVENLGFVVDEPPLFAVSPTVTNVTCNGDNDGSISLVVAGGTAPYTYSWSDGPTTQNRSGLSPGNYTVTVTDANGCQNVQPLAITEPPVLGLTYVQQNVACHGENTGLINITVSGGTAPYSYNWSNGALTEDVSNLTAGTYSVTVTDANGCIVGETVTITEPPTALSYTSVVQQISCNGAADGQINLTVSGGTAPYTYNWSNGSTSEDLSSLPAANYTVTITDANGCIVGGAFNITDPSPLGLSGNTANVSCKNAADGSIDLIVTGGEAPYTYIWAHGPSTEDVNGLGPGSYSVQVVDNRGCSQSTAFTITEPDELTLGYTQTNVLCFGQSTGAIDLTVAGGTGPFTYSWTNGANTEDVNGLAAGTYTVTVTDANGCVKNETITITEPAAALAVTDVQSQVTCNGFSNGSIDLTVTGGTAPYSYSWNDGPTTQDRAGLAAGNYNVTITDANGCSINDAYTITEPSLLVTSVTSDNITCEGAADGSIDLNVTGGTLPYAILWSDGITTEDRSGLGPGIYTVTITDANGCQENETVTITQPADLVATAAMTDVDCFGNSTGAIDLTAAGGTAPYTYSWSTGASTEDLLNLTVGSYTVTVSDANGCTQVETFIVDGPAQPLALNPTVNDITCFGNNDGNIQLNVTGGTAPYTYSWSNGETTSGISGLLVGNYNVTVTDANGCTLNGNYTIDTPAALQIIGTVQNLNCNAAGNGAVDLTVTGGTLPYSFSWSNGSTTEDLSSLSAGTYQVLVTDANGCTLNRSYTVTEPLALVQTAAVTDVSCFGVGDGAIAVAVTGGVTPYSYSWSSGEVTEDLFNISGGTFTLTITDANGCQSIETYTVAEAASALAVTASVTNLTCENSNNGAVDLTVSGGTAPYTFSWNQGSTNEDVFSLAAGIYQVIITDAKGCQLVENYTVTEPDALVSSFSFTDITCFGADDGSIDLTVSGGTSPYTYNWSDGASSQDRSNLSPGTYSVNIIDANGCVNTETITIDEPAAVALAYNQTNVLCFGNATGAIDLSVSGGTAPYSYSWSNSSTTEDLTGLAAGTYNVTVTDANGCSANETVVITQPTGALVVVEALSQVTCNGLANGSIDLTVTGGTAPYSYSWSDGAAIEDRSALKAGDYTVVVTDANGCQQNHTYVITEPEALTTSLTSSNVSCFGLGDGAIDLAVSGGTSPYSFLWSDGVTLEDRSALAPGTYSVSITDANGCQNNETVTITEPATLVLGHTKVDVHCHGDASGAVDILITGGTAPYSYSWSNGSNTEDQLSLAAGNYSVTVTDANGCTVSESFVINEPLAPLSVTGTTTNESCAGASNGAIDITVSGGTAPYSYSWNTGSSTQDIAGLLPGTYQVTVTDNLGCSTVQDFTITGPQPLSLTGAVTNISCYQAADGQVDLTVSGGTAPYTFAWSDGQTVEDAVDLDKGSYSVLVTDANGCTETAVFVIEEPLELIANHLVTDVTCYGLADGTIDLGVTGGTAPYTYAWSTGPTTQDLANLTEGTYSVVVTDARGCQVNAAITVEGPSAPLAATAVITDASCNGLPTGRIEISVTGGTAPYSYSWSNGSSQKNLLNAFAGEYALTVTDINGCQWEAFYTVDEPSAITPTFDITNSTCFGDSDGSIRVTTSGGQAPYTYVWSNGSTSQDQFNLTGGTYNVTITDANNCSVTESVVVGDSRDLSVLVSKQDIACKGETNGAISLNVTGGSGSYTYLWNDGSTTRDLSGVAAGVYHVVISDAGGCATTATVVIAEPAQALSAAIDQSDNLNCFGANEGFAKVVPQGGIAPYTYLWSNGARTASINQLTAGEYTVSVTDANGCIVQESFSIEQPEQPLSIMVSGNLNLACKGNGDGSVELEVNGGTAPYSYLWSTGASTRTIDNLKAGDYTVRVVDALGCVKEKQVRVKEPDELMIANARVNQSQCFDDRNGSIELEISGGTRPYSYQWSNQAITKNLIGISSGTYRVMVTDARGCQAEATYLIAKPELFRLQPVVSEISCVGADDASISLNIEGGVGQLAIQWNTGNVGETITDLKPGQYNVTVTDENDCTLQQTFNIIEPLPISLDAYVQDAVKCGDPKSGRINLIVSGGREPYRYRWTNGDTTQSLINILPGTYAVQVIDRYGCTTSGTYSVQQPEPLRIGLRTDIVIDCENRTVDNRVTAEVSGGFGGYQYKWSRGGSDGPENIVSEPGRLTLQIIDDQGCELSKSIDITIPELGEADFDFTSESIVRDGEAAANDPVSFFDESYGDIIDWNWDFGDGFDSREIDPIHTFAAPGTYTVTLTITDGSGCTSTQIKEIVITEGYRIMVPDAFSPNGDGNNDFFRPRMLGLEKVQLLVFNTWGEVIFSTEDVNTPGWDGYVNGQPAENGNYVYKLIGLSFNGLKVERDGVFALID